jgi:hypothetical protein
MGNGGDVGPVKIGPNEIDHANMTDKIGPYETGPLKKKTGPLPSPFIYFAVANTLMSEIHILSSRYSHFR